jgi:hypothetical protein
MIPPGTRAVFQAGESVVSTQSHNAQVPSGRGYSNTPFHRPSPTVLLQQPIRSETGPEQAMIRWRSALC